MENNNLYSLHEKRALNYTTRHYMVKVEFSKHLHLDFTIPQAELNSENSLILGTYNNKNYVIRRMKQIDRGEGAQSTESVALRESFNKEYYILERDIGGVIEFKFLLETPYFTYALMSQTGIRLIDFLNNWATDYDLKKRILIKILWTLFDLHTEGIEYNNDMYDNIIVKYGPSKEELSVKIFNFMKAKIHASPLEEEFKRNDYKCFGNLMIYIFSNGQIYDWKSETCYINTLGSYFDKETAIHLLKLIFGNEEILFKDIVTHPTFWTYDKIIQYFNRLYILVNFENGAMILKDEDSVIFNGSWDKVLTEVLEKRLKAAKDRNVDIGNGNLIPPDKHLREIRGLVSYIRHTCDIHYFNMTKPMKVAYSLPPGGIAMFLEIFPKLLIKVYYLVKSKFLKPDEKADKKAIFDMLHEFYYAVQVDNYGNTVRLNN